MLFSNRENVMFIIMHSRNYPERSDLEYKSIKFLKYDKLIIIYNQLNNLYRMTDYLKKIKYCTKHWILKIIYDILIYLSLIPDKLKNAEKWCTEFAGI